MIDRTLVVACAISVATSVAVAVTISRLTMPAPPTERLDEISRQEDDLAKREESTARAVADLEKLGTATATFFAEDHKALAEHLAAQTPAWWCWMARCERTEEKCRGSITVMMAQALEAGNVSLANRAAKQHCKPARHAFCMTDGQCFGDLSFCLALAKSPSQQCMGVE